MNKVLIFEKIHWWFVANMVFKIQINNFLQILNASWLCIYVINTDASMGISAVIIYSLLITLIVIYSRINDEYQNRNINWIEVLINYIIFQILCMRFGFGVYLGWVTAATILNTAQALFKWGLNEKSGNISL